MDGIYRKAKYSALLDKLNKLSGDPEDNESEKIQVLQDEVNRIIESLRNRGDQSNARIHYFLLIVPLVIVVMWNLWISHKILENGFIVLVMLLALGLIHYRIGVAIKRSHNAHLTMSKIPNDTKNFISTKLAYLEYALDIKKTRLALVCLFYILFFPVLLVKLFVNAIGLIPFNSLWVAYLIAYIISGTMWYFFFSKNFEVYDQIDEDIKLIQGSI